MNRTHFFHSSHVCRGLSDTGLRHQLLLDRGVQVDQLMHRAGAAATRIFGIVCASIVAYSFSFAQTPATKPKAPNEPVPASTAKEGIALRLSPPFEDPFPVETLRIESHEVCKCTCA
jgi:hypothetical protein